MISGFYGVGNTGDEAILEAIIVNLRDELKDPDITVFSLSPKKTAREHEVKSIYRGWRHDFKEKVNALRRADLLISGGGGLLQDTYPTRFLFGPLPYYLLIVFVGQAVRDKGHVFLSRHRSGLFHLGKNSNEGIGQYGGLCYGS